MQQFTNEELENEIWKDIEGYKYNYQISDLGRFRNLNAFHKSLKSPTTGSYDLNGYLRVSLTFEGGAIGKKIHRLVAKYFLNEYDESLTVNHKDFKKDNNRVSNLEMLTASENIKDFFLKNQNKFSNTYSGVNFHKRLNKWVSSIRIEGKIIALGTYTSEVDALEARNKFEAGLIEAKIGKGALPKYNGKDVVNMLYLLKVVTKQQILFIFNITLQTLNRYINDNYHLIDSTDVDDWVKEVVRWESKPKKKGKESHLFKDKTGQIILHKSGEFFKVIEYNSKYDCSVEFEDGTKVNNIRYIIAKNARFKKYQ